MNHNPVDQDVEGGYTSRPDDNEQWVTGAEFFGNLQRELLADFLKKNPTVLNGHPDAIALLLNNTPKVEAAKAFDLQREIARLQVQTDAKELVAAAQKGNSTGWKPADIGALIAAGMEPLHPTLLPRTDGVCLLYPGRTHSFNGESGSGKSWLAQHVTAEVLKSGGRALYLDYESSAASVVARLRSSMGCTDKQLMRLVYVRPETAPEGSDFEMLLGQPFDVAVVDGVTEALALSGLSGDSLTNNNDAVTKWHAMLPKRIAEATGAAVVQVDHVTKSKDSRGGYAIGAQAKRSTVTGASYNIVERDKFGRGHSGSFDLYVSKDREGYVQGALGGENGATGTHVCRVEVSCGSDDSVELTLHPSVAAPSDDDKLNRLMNKVLDVIWELPPDHEGLPLSAIRSMVQGPNADIDKAAKALVQSGRLDGRWKGRAYLHRRSSAADDFGTAEDPS